MYKYIVSPKDPPVNRLGQMFLAAVGDPTFRLEGTVHPIHLTRQYRDATSLVEDLTGLACVHVDALFSGRLTTVRAGDPERVTLHQVREVEAEGPLHGLPCWCRCHQRCRPRSC